jgi:hypothetical protein
MVLIASANSLKICEFAPVGVVENLRSGTAIGPRSRNARYKKMSFTALQFPELKREALFYEGFDSSLS